MDCIFVGNLAVRVEIKGKSKKQMWGGPSYFGAIVAKTLGCNPTIISKVSSNFDPKWLKYFEKENINLIKIPAWKDMIYEVTYDNENNREAKVIEDPGPIVAVPKTKGDVIIINSYFGKVGLSVLQNLKEENNLLVLDAQGYIRDKDPDGKVINVPWLDKEDYLRYVDIIKINANELFFLTGKKTLNSASNLLKLGPKIVVLTLGAQGSYIFYEKKYAKIPIYETNKYEHAGIGDVYITSFAIRYKETNDVIDAGYFASAAASFVSEGIIPNNREKIEKRCKTLREIFLV